MSKHLSKFLSLVLRHEPQLIGIALDSAGWTDVSALLAAAAAHGTPITREQLAEIVATSDKQRFALSDDGSRIRANQGHSVEVELELAPATPPTTLYHGTVDRFLASIRDSGLVKGARHHVHLSADLETAQKVGGRRGKPVILLVRAAEMVAAGHTFFVSQNGVWLTDRVPADFIDFPEAAKPNPHASGSVSRSAKVKIAESSLAACDAGFYTNAKGARVELAVMVEAAKQGTVLYELGDALEVPARAITVPARAITVPTRATTVPTRAITVPTRATTVPTRATTVPTRATTVIEVTGESTLEAMMRLTGRTAHLACLNFASARHPGGGFLGGAQAQEESLARASALYPCLLTHEEHYERNRNHRSLLYLDLALWSPFVPFFRDDDGAWLAAPVLASVITCAAPNAGALGRNVSVEELEATLVRRGRFVLAIARHHEVETLVLGAWGTGVFKNDPVMVARIFKRLLAEEFAGVFARVVFAVIGTVETSANHRAFAETFAEMFA